MTDKPAEASSSAFEQVAQSIRDLDQKLRVWDEVRQDDKHLGGNEDLDSIASSSIMHRRDDGTILISAPGLRMKLDDVLKRAKQMMTAPSAFTGGNAARLVDRWRQFVNSKFLWTQPPSPQLEKTLVSMSTEVSLLVSLITDILAAGAKFTAFEIEVDEQVEALERLDALEGKPEGLKDREMAVKRLA